MLTEKDIDKVVDRLVTVVATKKELYSVKEELQTEIRELKETVQSLATAVDRLVKPLEDLRVEYAAVAMNLDRHEKWIKQLAQKMGVALEA